GRAVRGVGLVAEVALVEEDGPLPVLQAVVTLADVEEHAGRLEELVGLGVAGQGLLEAAQLVVGGGLIDELLGLLLGRRLLGHRRRGEERESQEDRGRPSHLPSPYSLNGSMTPPLSYSVGALGGAGAASGSVLGLGRRCFMGSTSSAAWVSI